MMSYSKGSSRRAAFCYVTDSPPHPSRMAAILLRWNASTGRRRLIIPKLDLRHGDYREKVGHQKCSKGYIGEASVHDVISFDLKLGTRQFGKSARRTVPK